MACSALERISLSSYDSIVPDTGDKWPQIHNEALVQLHSRFWQLEVRGECVQGLSGNESKNVGEDEDMDEDKEDDNQS